MHGAHSRNGHRWRREIIVELCKILLEMLHQASPKLSCFLIYLKDFWTPKGLQSQHDDEAFHNEPAFTGYHTVR